MKKIPKTKNLGAKSFAAINAGLIVLISLVCLLPMLNVLALSFSSGWAISSGKVGLVPVDFTLDAYSAVFKNSAMVQSFFFTAILTATYTGLSMLMTIGAAYALTKKALKGRRFFLLAIVLTMYFNAGIIPNYLMINNLGLIDTMWSLVLPGLISAYNLIILRSFFQSLPESILEAAYMDGCSELGILVRIVLPLSLPALATVSLFYAVSRWNGFQDALYYINSQELYPLQLRLREIIVVDRMAEIGALEGGNTLNNLVSENIKSASIMFATVPILLVYPLLQKYFISGAVVGAIKE